MSAEDFSEEPVELERFGILDNLTARSSVDYRYNYQHLAPLAMLHAVPRADKPSFAWMMRVVWQSLRIAQNRVTWAVNTGRAVRPGDEVLTFSGDSEMQGSTTLNFDHLGLPELDLLNTLLDEECPTPIAPGSEPGIGEEIISLSHDNDTIREGFTPRVLAQELAAKLLSFGLSNPLDVLETILRSLLDGPSGRPLSLDDYYELFATLRKPWIANRPDDDEIFAWMRVAGWNPLVIQRISSIPDRVSMTDAQFVQAMHDAEDSIALACREGRLYLADYAILSDVVNGSFPSGPKYCFAPMALFALPRGTEKRRLRPIAIQCGQDSNDYRLFTPADGDLWRKAKLCLTVADTNHHELVSHIGRTHLLVEPIAIATFRVLSDNHPIGRLLVPHFEGTVAINSAIQSKQLRKGFVLDRLLAGTIEASRSVTVASLSGPCFQDACLPKALAARDVLDDKLDYPYRDDALLVWHAIERWVHAYVSAHYDSDDRVAQDAALTKWAREIVSKEGGRLTGFGEDGQGKLTTISGLVETLSAIIFTSSAQHAAVNFSRAELMTFPPAAPYATYRAAPLSKSESARNPLLDMLAPMEIAMLQVESLSLLGGVFHTKLGAYPAGWFRDSTIQRALHRFQQDLAGIGRTIEDRNRSRLGPYPFFMPERIPQSINI